MSEYVVIYEQAEDGGWGAYLPDLPGVVAVGASRDEVVELIAEAVAAYLEVSGPGLPSAPLSAAGTISISSPD